MLGLLVEGSSNQEIAQMLVVAQRTVAAHLEHILGKLEAATRTLAAVRAERDGLYVPACLVDGRATMNPVPPPRLGSARTPCVSAAI